MIKTGATILLFFCALGILLSLGTWQLKRLIWKNQIIENLDIAYNNPKTDIELTSTPVNEFLYATIQGVFLPAQSIYLQPKTHNGQVGGHLVMPLAAQGESVFINLGWVSAEDFLDILKREQVSGSVTGLFRKPEWNDFTSGNVPEQDLWFRLDVEEIAASKNLAPPYSSIVMATQAEPDFGSKLHLERWYPRNKHMQYALFWYALAGCLVIVFGLRARQNKK